MRMSECVLMESIAAYQPCARAECTDLWINVYFGMLVTALAYSQISLRSQRLCVFALNPLSCP